MPNYANIPAEMRALPNWVNFGIPGAKKLKEPRWPRDLSVGAMADNLLTWTTFDQAVSNVPGRAQGIGFEFGVKPSGFVGIDFDHVLHDGVLDSEVAAWVERLDSYTEVSPSGDGLHVFMRGFMPPELKTCESGIKLTKADPYQIEVYDCKRYFTVTGNVYGPVRPLREYDDDAQAEITDFCEWLRSIKKNRDELSSVELDATPQDDAPADDGCLNFDDLIYTDEICLNQTPTSNADWLQIGLNHDEKLSALYNRTELSGDESSDDLALLNKLAFWLNRDPIAIKAAFEQSPFFAGKDDAHKAKWNRSASPYSSMTIQKAIAGCKETAAERNAAYQAQRAAERAAAQESKPTEKKSKSTGSSDFEPFDPFETTDPAKQRPPFPVECFPPQIRDYVKAVADSTRTPVDMAATMLLGAFSLATSGLYRVRYESGFSEPTNLFVVTIGRSSECKTAVKTEISHPIEAFQAAENARRAPSLMKYQDRLKVLNGRKGFLIDQASKGKLGKNGIDPNDELLQVDQELCDLEPVQPYRIITSDATPEAVSRLLYENNERLGIVSDEGSFFANLSRYSKDGDAQTDIFCQGWSNSPSQTDRITRSGGSLKHPYLSVNVSIQPKTMARALENAPANGAEGTGLYERFLYSYPISLMGGRPYTGPQIPAELTEYYSQLITDFLELQVDKKKDADPQMITLSPEASAKHKELFYSIEPRLKEGSGDLADFTGWAGKLTGQVARIAGLLHCMRHGFEAPSVELSGDTMAAAVEIGKYYLAHAQYVLKRMEKDVTGEKQDAQYIWDKIKSAKVDRMSKRGLLRLCRRFDKTSEMQAGLDELTSHGYIMVKKVPQGKTGRMTEAIFLSPDAAAECGL